MQRGRKNMLSKRQLKELRKQIILNSLYLKDYDNNLYIKSKNVCDFFDSYIEELSEKYNTNDIDEILKHDNIDELWNYYKYLEFDPLFQNDYIATKSLTNFSSIVIYDVNYGLDNYVIIAFVYSKDLNGSSNSKLTKNKIYCDNDGNAYFIKNKCKYYLSEFVRV